jgi:hypothetical protein
VSEEVPVVNVHLTIGKGTAIVPSWFLILLSSLFVLSSLCLILVFAVESRMIGEVRVMQIYEEDIENVLIRANIATRADFAPHPHPAQGAKP